LIFDNPVCSLPRKQDSWRSAARQHNSVYVL
jgi:hypothetical protein